MIRRFVVVASLVPALLRAQSQGEFAGRRQELASKLPDGVFVALGAHEPAEDFLSFEQNPWFYYLTGFREPDATLVMVRQKGSVSTAMMFVEPRQPSREAWTGSRIGVEGIRNLTGIQGRSSNDILKVLDSLAATGMSFNVVGDVALPGTRDEINGMAVRSADEQLLDRVKSTHPSLKVTPVNDIVERMRGHKSASELTLIRNAVDLTVRAFKETIPTIKPGMNEFELQALIEFTFRRNGATRPSFSSIVGSGPNSTTLHYNANDRFMGATDVVVMDVGASFKGYAADVTRTVPVAGTFSTEQRAVYQVVRDAQKAAERQALPGNPARFMTDSSNAVIANGLTKLGLIESPSATYDCTPAPNPRPCEQFQLYYMHGLGHGIGLEVHDPEQFYFTGTVQPGSAFTIEPGIYVREHLLEEIPDTPRNREFAARVRAAVSLYKNIGVRIEDDYIATVQGLEWISQVPREIPEIEAMMKAGSPGIAARDEFRVEKYRTTP